MKKQQQTALDNPCRFAFETMHPRFHVADRHLSIILTVNYGYE